MTMASKMNNYQIRKAKIEDLVEIATLYKEFWGDESNVEQMHNRFDKFDQDSRYLLLVAELDSKIVGTILGIVCDELYGECLPFMVMEDLVVASSHKRKGIASLLISRLEEYAKQMKCSQIQFITESNRPEAIRFYESIGFDSKKNIGFKKKL